MSRGAPEHRITSGGYAAVVTEIGGGLRLLSHEDRDLIRPYGADEIRPRYRGALLAPWPNRVVDGRYSFDGEQYQLDLTEPARGHALHGLVAWSRFALTRQEESSVTVTHRIAPRTSYPFEIELRATYALDDHGLSCTVTAENHGDRAAPYGVGSHPYLVAGDGPVDRWSLELPARQVLAVTGERLLPVGLVDVAGGTFDFREPRSLSGVQLDHAYTAVSAGSDGVARARVRTEDGSGVECSWDPAGLPWVQVHTADLPPPERSRAGLALEPMSCPPDAFSSGTDLRRLEPGDTVQDAWRVSAL
ncbi:MAG: aldose 1-epimerase [Nocardioidaceae bacterium]|nr:aldose 1-epimerase [Nocardioidaceae bacterium]